MNWRKFNKKSELWIFILIIFLGICQAILFISDGNEILKILGNSFNSILIVLLSSFLAIYTNKTRFNANKYFNEIIEVYLKREYYVKEKRLDKDTLNNDIEFKKLTQELYIKFEIFKVYSQNIKQNEELEKYIFEYEETPKIKNFLNFIKDEVVV